MSFKLNIDAKADQLSLTISGFDAENAELIEARLTEITDVLNEILASDAVASDLTQSEQDRLHPALTALELKYKWLLHQATEQARAAKSVAEGYETISQHGFAEFDDA
jgi:ElaB/YqjD/DUF883 family membrane-anchored ribosome-binding protein